MKLSEAILRGCEIAPKQLKHQYWDGELSACALGAACLAIGIDPRDETLSMLNLFDGCPLDELNRVVDQNDELGWTREQIAASLAECGL